MTLSPEDFRASAPGLPCGIATVLAALPENDRDVLQAALDDPTVQHAAIERGLKKNGIDSLRALQIGRHRHGQCRCQRGV